MRAVPREVAVDDQRVAELDVALLPAPPRERTRAAALARPLRHVALVVLHIDVEVRVWIRPLDLRDGADEPHRLVAVEFGGERMMGRGRNGCDEAERRHERRKFRVHASENRWVLRSGQEPAAPKLGEGEPSEGGRNCFDTGARSSYDFISRGQ